MASPTIDYFADDLAELDDDLDELNDDLAKLDDIFIKTIDYIIDVIDSLRKASIAHNAELVKAKTPDAVLALTAAAGEKEDAINRASALFRIAKTFMGSVKAITPSAASLDTLERMHPSLRRQARVLTADPRYVALMDRIAGDVRNMSVRQAASVAWGLARLYDNRAYGGDEVALLSRVRDQFGAEIARAAGRGKGGLAREHDTSVGIAMWALGKVGAVDGKLADALVGGLSPQLQSHSSETLVSVVWALAKTPATSESPAVVEFLAESLDELGRRAKSLPNASLSLMAWAGAKQAVDAPVFFSALEKTLAERDLAQFSTQSLTNILWAFEQTAHFLPHLSPRLMAAMEAKLAQLSATDVSHLYLWLAQSQLLSETFTQRIVSRALELLPVMSNIELTKVLLAVANDESGFFASMAAEGSADKQEVLQAFAVEAESRLALLDPVELAMTTYGFAKASFVAVPLFDEFASASLRRIGEFERHSLAQLAWAYAANGHHSDELMTAIEDRAVALVPGSTASDLNMVLSAFAKLNHPAPRLCKVIANELAKSRTLRDGLAGEFDTRAATFLGWSYAVLGEWSPEVADLVLHHMSTSGARALLSDESWMQVYQFEAAFREASAAAVLRGYRTQSMHAFAIEKPAYSSQLHQEVSTVLDRLGIEHETEHVTDDGMAVVDIVIDGPQPSAPRIAIEVDGPLHYCSNVPRRERGRTVAKRQLLESSGYVVVHIAYFEWNEVGSDASKERLLRRKLQIANLAAFSHEPVIDAKTRAAATAGATDEAEPSLLRRLVRKWVFGDS
ncbi:uncharacterized protein AMSG_11451 [Thecamonas trahens ATCC 50062]|uniref:RAP domain-containing protein n=1 Tax=Thecamonas trahens ATCC 50062 TaxID=461836 RepID=A0A0L0DXE4_THETB|nr:hypothetical protein AMSG_11451 [Thecamonas trahens ATCC 50062]KNC56203.1 hypothetical protein AMSG_11451 [Thecamonas trahens ATCC 50062]|eukprot:XP_013752680.1 hypothetical protein AMSG_11451 [Thecamonas trahens ATCC 50062]